MKTTLLELKDDFSKHIFFEEDLLGNSPCDGCEIPVQAVILTLTPGSNSITTDWTFSPTAIKYIIHIELIS